MTRFVIVFSFLSLIFLACASGDEGLGTGDVGTVDAGSDVQTTDTSSTDVQSISDEGTDSALDVAQNDSASTDEGQQEDTLPIIDTTPPGCDEPQVLCGALCVDLDSNTDHCGACNAPCAFGASCSDGACACPENFSLCGSSCVNPSNNTAHCGACDNACDSTEVCTEGSCSCAPGFTLCAFGCANTLNDANNCGGCGLSCGPVGTCADGACVLPKPRALSPLSTARTTTDSPLLKWELPEGLTGAIVEICNDRLCESIEQYFEVVGTETQTIALAPGRYFWRLYGVSNTFISADPTPLWQLRIPHIQTVVNPAGTHFGKTLDLNGDGFDDVVVGACDYLDPDCVNTAYIFLSSLAGRPSDPNSVVNPPVSADGFGSALAPAGDVNGDGISDLIVGAYNTNDAFIFHGGTLGPSPTPDTVIHFDGGLPPLGAWFGIDVDGVGDVNGDGYGDVAVGATLESAVLIYPGGPEGVGLTPIEILTADGAGLGISLSNAGDINGDTYPDIIAGATDGKVAVFIGKEGGMEPNPIHILTGPDGFGTSVASAGDLNRDGFSDVVIGAPSSNVFYVYFGSPSGLLVDTPFTSVGANEFGISVATGGDVNGDGYDDLLVGSQGEVFFYYGAPGTTLGAVEVLDVGIGTSFGATVSSAGDVNGDRFQDLIIGDKTSQKAYGFIGQENGVTTIPSYELAPIGAQPFGATVGGAN